jgi:hypothetical protein
MSKNLQFFYICRMASIKPSVPKGTRDFSPAEMVKRNYIFDTIKAFSVSTVISK